LDGKASGLRILVHGGRPSLKFDNPLDQNKSLTVKESGVTGIEAVIQDKQLESLSCQPVAKPSNQEWSVIASARFDQLGDIRAAAPGTGHHILAPGARDQANVRVLPGVLGEGPTAKATRHRETYARRVLRRQSSEVGRDRSLRIVQSTVERSEKDNDSC
jgi:hypothetical protein